MIREDVLLAHAVFRNADMAMATGLSASSVSRALRRYRARGVVVEVTRGLWAVPQHPHFSTYGVVPFLLAQEQGYVSYLSALQRHGVLSQLPPEHYVATTGHTRRLTSAVGEYRFLQMAPRYMQQGIVWHDSAMPYAMATAEKALLDCLYVSTRRGTQFAFLPELDMRAIGHRRFVSLVQQHAFSKTIHGAIVQRYARLQAEA